MCPSIEGVNKYLLFKEVKRTGEGWKGKGTEGSGMGEFQFNGISDFPAARIKAASRFNVFSDPPVHYTTNSSINVCFKRNSGTILSSQVARFTRSARRENEAGSSSPYTLNNA
ncbi:hypothetical protein E2C01_024904 [Portunus trituberculatus]|uniref:Uncharacterized protein n=1 Tax=Portunus trituberculatus TaxID=210409 RepID=A0A5B7EBH7_PORTR|nr:hypothetical protein [Portunus trituberculatus]